MGKRGPAPGMGGRPAKPLADKLLDGNPGKRSLSVIDFKNAVELEGKEMPSPRSMLSARQKDGKPFEAMEVYESTWLWLKERGCSAIISPQLLERYAMSVARWIQCETAITEYGFLSKHPTTGSAIQSPFVSMAQSYMSQTNRLWCEIFQLVKENCAGDYTGANPQDDVMEKLLTARKGGCSV